MVSSASLTEQYQLLPEQWWQLWGRRQRLCCPVGRAARLLTWHIWAVTWHGLSTSGLLQVQAEVDELPAASTYSSQGESAEELKRLREEERKVESEVHSPAPLFCAKYKMLACV